MILDHVLAEVKRNHWMGYFTIFVRFALAAGFIPSGMVKIMGERFTSLSVNHPMGHYLEALYHTGSYYTFIGVMQVTAAILLLKPRTATLGALLYMPIILNICVLSMAVRFEGSLVTSPLMVLANLYLLCWDYDRLKYILPRRRTERETANPFRQRQSRKFPAAFFAVAAGASCILVLMIVHSFTVMPRNTLKDCKQQFEGTNRMNAGERFCNCIHKYGFPLDISLREYYNTPDDTVEPYLEPLLPSAVFLEW